MQRKSSSPNPALPRGIGGIERDAGGDGIAVADAESREQLELVRGPVAEIERARAAHLERVAAGADVIEVQLRATLDEVAHRAMAALAKGGGVLAEKIEERPVADDGDLERLGDAAAPLAVRERGEEMEIVEHGEGRGEGADGVFAARKIDRRFYADRAVALGEGGGGDADDAQSAVDQRGGEAQRHRAPRRRLR